MTNTEIKQSIVNALVNICGYICSTQDESDFLALDNHLSKRSLEDLQALFEIVRVRMAEAEQQI